MVEDLQEVEGIKCLDNPIIIQSISNKFPINECGDQYIQRRLELHKDGKSEFEILSTFITEE